MLERLIEVLWPVCSVLSNRNVTKLADATTLEMKDNQWALAEMLIPCLKPLKVATVVLSAEENVSSSIIHPIISGLMQHHLDVKDNDEEAIWSFKNTTRLQLETRFRQPDFQVGAAAMGAAVDPRYKDLAFLPQADREVVKAEVRRCLGALQQVRGDAEREKGAADDDDDDEHAAELGVNFLMGAASPPAQREKSADDEYDEFLAQPSANVTVNPLMWWQGSDKRLPLLQQLPRKYLGIPATSVPSERVFSTAGNIVTAKRNCLLPENVDMLIFLSKNK
eukprot:XP_799085.1 PREDICTED: zinc finger BED domain-containing protein 1-like [Strongylocentrotus purpuratus]